MVVKGPTIGGNDGSAFELWRENKPVEQLDIWYGPGTGDNFKQYTILKGIKVRWAGDKHGQEEGHAGYCPNEDKERILHTSFDFESNGNDPLEWMDIYGSTGRADSLRLVTHNERDYFEAGGIGGEKRVQPAGGRKLHGFYGKAGDDIDQLGGVFNN
ncbi:hypothetical protein BDW59DRAFT_160314 [Aspergillus cavernicola]|uniref:Jacalin-type lectin domain-containing protein n=1 Tax=Aspergillus cavernicola TaxID=176166 RepID=A0ABR4IHV0_9EURO